VLQYRLYRQSIAASSEDVLKKEHHTQQLSQTADDYVNIVLDIVHKQDIFSIRAMIVTLVATVSVIAIAIGAFIRLTGNDIYLSAFLIICGSVVSLSMLVLASFGKYSRQDFITKLRTALKDERMNATTASRIIWALYTKHIDPSWIVMISAIIFRELDRRNRQ